jgi:hypothetical protein
MPHRMLTDADIVTIISVNLGGIMISLSDVELVLRVVSITVAIGYTVWKWRKDLKEKK